MITKIQGQHRSLEQAERHLREIEKENPGATVRISSRRDVGGKFNSRGTRFIFEIETKKEPEKKEKPEKQEANSLEEFFDFYDDAIEYEIEEYGARPEYGEE